MKIVFYGLTITSSWGNGHATTYRSLCKALTRRGHSIHFVEKDVKWYRNIAISEIIVDIVGETLELVIHWQGGDHTRLTVKKNRNGRTRWCTDTDIVDLVRALARQMPDETIAAVLNRTGRSTSYGNTWTRGRICSLRRQYDIAIHRPGERAERGEATLDDAAAALAISNTTVRRLIASGALPASQACKGAPWIVRQADLSNDEVRRVADARRSRRPQPDDRQQNLLDL